QADTHQQGPKAEDAPVEEKAGQAPAIALVAPDTVEGLLDVGQHQVGGDNQDQRPRGAELAGLGGKFQQIALDLHPALGNEIPEDQAVYLRSKILKGRDHGKYRVHQGHQGDHGEQAHIGEGGGTLPAAVPLVALTQMANKAPADESSAAQFLAGGQVAGHHGLMALQWPVSVLKVLYPNPW